MNNGVGRDVTKLSNELSTGGNSTVEKSETFSLQSSSNSVTWLSQGSGSPLDSMISQSAPCLVQS